MYRKLSRVFVPAISIFSLGAISISVSASENNSGLQKFKASVNKVTITNEQELIEALNNENVNEILVEGDVIIAKKIDLTKSSRNVKLIIGSDSSLIVVQGTKINGNGKLTIVKSNNSDRQAITFKKVMSTGGVSETVFQNLTFSGVNGEILMDNTIDNLSIKNVNLENLTLFRNEKNNTQVLSQVNFLNSSVNLNQNNSINISQENLNLNTNSVDLNLQISSTISTDNLIFVAVDNQGNVFKSKNISTDRLGNVQASIENLNHGSEYKVYFGISHDENKNFFFGSPVKISTLNFKSSIESQTHDGVKIRISENNLDSKYYPLYLVLKYEGVEFKKVQIPAQTTSGDIVLNITGLIDDKNYEYEILSYVNENSPKIISKGNFKTPKNYFVSGGGLVSGVVVNNSSNSDSKILSFNISDEDIKKSNIEDTHAEIYLNENVKSYVSSGKNLKTNFEGVNVEFVNGKLLITKLIPGKNYSGLKIYFETGDGKSFVLSLSKFTTHDETQSLNKFVKDVYLNAFDRTPDENGFWYWVDKLSVREVGAEEFIKNLLNESEFISKRPTTESKIEGLYKVIVNRNSDAEGLKFWVSSYDSLVSKGYSENFALKMTVNNMVSQGEFQNIVSGLI